MEEKQIELEEIIERLLKIVKSEKSVKLLNDLLLDLQSEEPDEKSE